ncbi:MAG: hypothetical protein OXG03_07115 [Gammaproteobacteria bacterium]|nr:hypothetical protein [Gammaproteobacteria bacterium]
MNMLERQILDCFPSGKYALTSLLRLVDIVESDHVATASVECGNQPRLRINPTFVKQHAETPEKLLMLVMHELHHVLLGHTRLYEKITPIDNFVFDCVINAMLSRMLPQPEYLRLLTDFYSDKKFPECLLRPASAKNPERAQSIPMAIQAFPQDTRKFWEELYKSLYSETGVSYDEIRNALALRLYEDTVSAIPLLGEHFEDGEDGHADETGSSPLIDILMETAETWPKPGRGQSWAELVQQAKVDLRPVPGNRSVLRNLLARLGRHRSDRGSSTASDAKWSPPTPLPSLNRRAAVLRALGVQPMFHPGEAKHLRRTRTNDKAHVYVDVSGSVTDVLPAIYGAVSDCRSWIHPVVHIFSTVVHDLAFQKLQSGQVDTTGGTNIACVAEHMATHKVSRACIITDGVMTEPESSHLETLRQARLGIALVGDNSRAWITEVADQMATLTSM